MSVPSRLALTGATLISCIALFDAMHVGATGRSSGFSDQYGITPMMVAGSVAHGLAYASFVALLVAARRRIDDGSAARSWIRRLLIATFSVMAAMFLVGTWALSATAQAGLSVVGGVVFLLMFLLSLALGISLVRRPELRASAVTLIALVPGIGLAVGLQALGSDFAHPAYAEAAVAFGIALLGHRPALGPVPQAATVQAGAAN